MNQKNIKYHTLLSLLILGVLFLTLAIYWPGLSGPFLLDDFTNITSNFVDDFDREEILYVITHNNSGVLGRPVAVFSLLFSGIVHGPVPWGFKYHNLMLHLLNGLLIFWILFKLLPRFNPQIDQNKITLIAGFTATCWLLHPLMLSTVLYAVQRMAQLSSFFTLAALLTYIFARESALTHSVRHYCFAYLFFPLFLVLSLLSKENGALIPFYLLAIEITAYQFKFNNSLERNRVIAFLGVFAALPIMLGGIYVLTHFDSLLNYSVRDFTLAERLMTQLHVVVFYIKLILLPSMSDMSLFHDGWKFTERMDVLTFVLLLGLCTIIAFAIYVRKKAPVLSFGIAWFIISHLLESTFLSLELVFEHRNYLAALGLLLILFYYLFTMAKERVSFFITFIIVALFSFMTAVRANEWKNVELIYSIAVQDHPESIRAQTIYANILYSQGNLQEAINHLDVVIDLDRTEYGSTLQKLVYLCVADGNINNPSTSSDINNLYSEAYNRAGAYPASPYSFNGIDILHSVVRDQKCPHIDLQQVLDIIMVAMTQADNQINKEFLGFLQRQAGQIYYEQGDYIKGFEYTIAAYENTGLTSILAEAIDVQIQLRAFESAEHLITLIEEDDEGGFRSEIFRINELKETLNKAREAQAQQTREGN